MPDVRIEGGLTAEQARLLGEAAQLARSFRGAKGMALFNGWTSAILAAMSLAWAALSLLFGSISVASFLAAAVLGVVAFNELNGAAGIARLQPGALDRLMWNQVGFLAVITAYCIWGMVESWTTPISAETRDALAQLSELMMIDEAEAERLARGLGLAVYGLVLGLSVLFVGGCAVYYRRRSRRLRDYLAQTPEWIVTLQRSGWSG